MNYITSFMQQGKNLPYFKPKRLKTHILWCRNHVRLLSNPTPKGSYVFCFQRQPSVARKKCNVSLFMQSKAIVSSSWSSLTEFADTYALLGRPI